MVFKRQGMIAICFVLRHHEDLDFPAFIRGRLLLKVGFYTRNYDNYSDIYVKTWANINVLHTLANIAISVYQDKGVQKYGKAG
jgi:hypothetical protein